MANTICKLINNYNTNNNNSNNSNNDDNTLLVKSLITEITCFHGSKITVLQHNLYLTRINRYHIRYQKFNVKRHIFLRRPTSLFV